MRLIALIFVFSFISGCAVFKGNAIPLIPDEALDFRAKNPLKVYNKWVLDSDSSIILPSFKDQVESSAKISFEKSLHTAGCCVLVDSKEDADIVVDGVVIQRSNFAAILPAAITGASLYTIPSWATNNLKIEAFVRRKNGVTKNYTITDSTILVQWLPMIFVMPFVGDIVSVSKEVNDNMHKTLVEKIGRDRFFSGSSAAGF